MKTYASFANVSAVSSLIAAVCKTKVNKTFQSFMYIVLVVAKEVLGRLLDQLPHLLCITFNDD